MEKEWLLGCGIVLILLLSPTLLYGQEGFFFNNYLVPEGHSNFVIDTSSLEEPQINLITDSLEKLVSSKDIIDYKKKNGKIFVDMDIKGAVRVKVTREGMFIIRDSKGYIVELKSAPVAEKGLRSIQEPGSYRAASLEHEEESTEKYRNRLKNEHESALSDFNDILNKEGLSEMSPKGIFGFIRELFIINNKDTVIGELLKISGMSPTGLAVYGPEIQAQREFYDVFNGIVLNISKEDAIQLKNSRYVADVYPNKQVKAVLFDSVPAINADILWGLDQDGNNCSITGKPCLNGDGMSIAIIDTGIDYTHTDLGGCLGPGCKVEGGYDFVNDDNDPIDDQGHGTHVAGIAAGDSELKGVAPKAKLYAYKVLDEGGSGSFSDVIAGIEMAVDPNDDGNFSDKADVMSLSLGGGGDPDDPVSKAIDNAVESGVVAVVAAGNDGPSQGSIGSPGCARNALTVGAICKESQIGVNDNCENIIAEFSSRGPVTWSGGSLIKPDVLAPGVDICSAEYDSAWEEKKCLDDRHVAISGTSMATPHVAGAAALIKQAKPELNAKQIKSLIETSSEDLGKGFNEQGNGKVNLFNALGSKILISESKISFGNINAAPINKNIVIKNLHSQPITLQLSAGSTFSEQMNQSYNMISLTESNLVIQPNSEYLINLTITAPPSVGGTFVGSILMTDNYGTNYSILYTASRLSNLTLVLEGVHYPYFYIYEPDYKYAKVAEAGWDFLGNRYTFAIPYGNYSVFAINDFLGSGETDEYLLMDTAYLPLDSAITKTFRLQDERLFTIKAESKKGNPLELFEWTKGIITYPRGLTADNSTFHVAFYDPAIGDRKIYLSKNKDDRLDVDILLKYLGAEE